MLKHKRLKIIPTRQRIVDVFKRIIIVPFSIQRHRRERVSPQTSNSIKLVHVVSVHVFRHVFEICRFDNLQRVFPVVKV
tara:strand:- start:1 stop:237 length:237 start_codon:yes stop_codon:yes gene_type:complete